MPPRRVTALVIGLLGLLTVAACGGADRNADRPSPPQPSVIAADGTFTSRFFSEPLTLEPAPGLAAPQIDTQNLLSWDSAATADDKVRIMVPIEVFKPGRAAAEPAPADMVGYVQGLTAYGARFSDRKKLTVGGHPATVSTVTKAGGPDTAGAFGCPGHGSDKAEDCFGPRPDLVLRLAVVDLGGKDLLAWARVPTGKPDQAFFDAFDRMLGTVRFT